MTAPAIPVSGLWHPYTRHSALEEGLPLIVRGEGPYLYDSTGRPYVDAISSWWAVNLGHSHPRIVAAITKQAAVLQHSILGGLEHAGALDLAARLATLFPGEARRVFFASDGASAVEAALKISVQHWANVGRPEKHVFASLANAYHGDTLGSVSVGFMEAFHAPFRPLLFPCHQASTPCAGSPYQGLQPHNCDASCLGTMEGLLERHADELAAVIVEPLCQGAAGMAIYGPGYLQRLAELCKSHHVHLIADEIATGFGRTGERFAHEHATISPDIICLGKALSGGTLPISAAVVRADLYETFDDSTVDRTFYHGHTFGGNPIACAAALAMLDAMEHERILEQACRGGDLLKQHLEKLCHAPGIVDARCLGMIGAVEFAAPPIHMHAKLLSDGFLLRPLGNVIYVMPPLNTPQDLLRAIIEAFVQAATEEGERQTARGPTE